MARQRADDTSTRVKTRTGRDPAFLAAVGSVLLAWYQFYVRGNKEHGLFIGLWPPTILAFANSVRIRDIGRKTESKAMTLIERLTQ